MNKFNVGDKVSLNGEIIGEMDDHYVVSTGDGYNNYTLHDEQSLTLVKKAKSKVKVGDYVKLIKDDKRYTVVQILRNEAVITWFDGYKLTARTILTDNLLPWEY